jgi:hypothetical protein
MMYVYLLEHLEKLRHVKRCKTCVSRMNAIFWCTEVAEMVSNQMHPFYSIGPNVVLSFRAFKKPSACKKIKNLCFGHECTILVYRNCENGFAPNACILLHWTQSDVWLSLGAFRKPLACKKMENL